MDQTVTLPHIEKCLSALLCTLFFPLCLPVVAQATRRTASDLAIARVHEGAVLLASGQVLVTGGVDVAKSVGDVATAELYDPASHTWRAAGSLATARSLQAAVLLRSGKVLVIGGSDCYGRALASAELYDAASNTWSAAASLATARGSLTATRLTSGRVLVTSGYNSWNGGDSGAAELYDPATNSWSPAGILKNPRSNDTATLLDSGEVLVAGGWGSNGALASAELYNPATNTWSVAGTLPTPRYGHTATLMPSGKVLVVGGTNGLGPDHVRWLASAEIFDPRTNTWSFAGTLAFARRYHTATLLPSGKVLVVGGMNRKGEPLGSAELYDADDNTWSAAGALVSARYGHTATLLSSGKVLVAGGEGLGFKAPTSTELYDPDTNTFSANIQESSAATTPPRRPIKPDET